MKKILWLLHYPTPYNHFTLNYISNGIRSYVEYISLWETDHKHKYWNFNHTLPNHSSLKWTIRFSKKSRLYDLHLGILKYLISTNYSLYIIPGFIPLTSLFSLIILILIGKKFIISIDSTRHNENSKSIHFLKRIIYRKASAFLVPGLASLNYLTNIYGIKNEKIFQGLYHINYNVTIKQEKGEEKQKYFKEFSNWDNSKRILLMVANFYPPRKYPILFEVIKESQNLFENIFFVIIGSGPDLKKCIIFAEKNHLKNYHIIENVKFKELHNFYKEASIYVHSGNEPYSTSIALASIHGLPILSSSKVGGALDYINQGSNGFLISNPDSVVEWLEYIKLFSTMPAKEINIMAQSSIKKAFERDKIVNNELKNLTSYIISIINN